MFPRYLRLKFAFSIPNYPRTFTQTTRIVANNANEIVSEAMKAEGGPAKGSTSAQMQSAVDKERNFEQTAQEIVGRMQSDPSSITSEDAAHLKSREARATGQAQPGADSISADAQRLAAANEGATKNSVDPKGKMSSDTQSAIDRKENFEDAAVDVGQKMKNDPQHVSKEEADLLHSREQRAFGQTEKGGVAAQAQRLAAENEGKTL